MCFTLDLFSSDNTPIYYMIERFHQVNLELQTMYLYVKMYADLGLIGLLGYNIFIYWGSNAPPSHRQKTLTRQGSAELK